MSPSVKDFLEKNWNPILWGLSIALIACMVFAGWLGWKNYHDPKMVRRFIGPGAPVCPMPDSLSDIDQVRACVNSLTFDPVAAVGDEQRLLVRDDGGSPCFNDSTHTHTCRHGPLAKIEPVIGADERDTSALNQGAIIARLFLRGHETESYPKLNLAPEDTTYWWVQRQSDSTATSRYLRVSKGQVFDTIVGTIKIEHHPEEEYLMSLARFIWDDGDEKTQGSCQPGSCCH